MRVFAKVVESGSFTGAAARLGISASMVSPHVKELEERLGARLLNRTTRKVSLTETGRAYYERCTRLLADLTARFPAISVELMLSERLVDLIAEGFDVAVRIEEPPDSSLDRRDSSP